MADLSDVAYRSLLRTIVGLGLVVRLAYAIGWRFDVGLRYDGPVYRNRADFLLAGRSFKDPDQWVFHRVSSEGAIHPPGNSLFIALGKQFGFTSDASIQIWGSLLGTATIVLVAYLGARVANRRVGLIAAFLVAIGPGFWSYDPSGMAETPAQFLVALTLLLAYQFWDDPTPSRAGWAAAAASGAALMRSELLMLLPLLIAPMAVAARGSARRVDARLAAVALWTAIVLTPWVGWNMVRFEHPVTMASGLDLTLAYTQCDPAWYGNEMGLANIFCGSDITRDPKNRLADESELAQQYRQAAGEYIGDNLSQLPAVVGARVGRTLGVYRPAQQITVEHNRESRERLVLWAALLVTWTSYALAAVALRFPPTSTKRLLPLLTPLVAGIAGAAITFGTSRYRSGAEVGLVVLAAVGIDALLRKRHTASPYNDEAQVAAGDPPRGTHG